MKRNGAILAIIAVGVLLAFIIYSAIIINSPKPIQLQGEVEATQMRVSSKLIGRIETLPVHRGDAVKAGQLLYTISSPEVDAKLAQAKAALSGAQAQSNKAETGAQEEDIQAAYNTYLKAKAAYELADKTFLRVKNLHEDGVLPAQKFDEAETRLKVALETSNAAKAVWEKAKKGARVEDKAAAGAMVERAKGVIEEIESYVNETHITAPISGEIANILAEKGELVPAGYPIVTIVDLNDTWIVFNLREDLLSSFKKGSVFSAIVPAMDNDSIRLQVSYINALGNFATWNATKTSGDFDMKTFEVHAVPVDSVAGLRPGMSVLVDYEQMQTK